MKMAEIKVLAERIEKLLFDFRVQSETWEQEKVTIEQLKKLKVDSSLSDELFFDKLKDIEADVYNLSEDIAEGFVVPEDVDTEEWVDGFTLGDRVDQAIYQLSEAEDLMDGIIQEPITSLDDFYEALKDIDDNLNDAASYLEAIYEEEDE